MARSKVFILKSGWMNGWIAGWESGRVGGCKGSFIDCLHESKVSTVSQA
jgi:hypothetical protein